MCGDENGIPLFSLRQEPLNVELPDRRLRALFENPALANDSLDLPVRARRIKQTQEMNALLRHRLEAGEDGDADRAGGARETFGAGDAEMIGHRDRLDFVLETRRHDCLVVVRLSRVRRRLVMALEIVERV